MEQSCPKYVHCFNINSAVCESFEVGEEHRPSQFSQNIAPLQHSPLPQNWQVDEMDLHESYMPGWRAAIVEARACGVMVCI